MRQKQIKIIHDIQEVMLDGLPALKLNLRFKRERSDTEIIITPVAYQMLKQYITEPLKPLWHNSLIDNGTHSPQDDTN